MNIFSGVLQVFVGSIILAFSGFSSTILVYGLAQIFVGLYIWTHAINEKKNRHKLLITNLVSFWFGFGLFIGPFLGLIELYKEYF